MVQLQPSYLLKRRGIEGGRLQGLVDCKFVLEQSCGTFCFCGDACDVKLKEKI